ncbi:endolytic transglycosylase MltG [bacterium]|nr:endolytic transglycosylase MltG [bacterium]
MVKINKKLLKLLIMIAAVFLFSSLVFTACNLNSDKSGATAESEIQKGLDVEVEIKEGMNLTQISNLLEEKGIIDSALFFKIYAEDQGLETKLIPGKYNLKTGSEYKDVLEVITSGPEIVTFKLIIPEGFMVKQISDRITQELPFIDSADLKDALKTEEYSYDFLKDKDVPVTSLEGFLFPKTYEILPQYSAGNIIEMLLSQYQFETSGLDYKYAADNNLTSYDILKIASMIEKEAYIPEERPLISAVIHNRLKINMALGIDATLTYFLDKWDEPLTESDLKTDTPFNTRIYTGLPPTPICNPGLESIKAALNPADADYLYYVVTDPVSHKHTFSKTLQEHNENTNSITTIK